jgi:hypothetical protein
MIVRVQSAGQYRLSDEQVARLQELDAQLVKTVDGDDEAGMHAAVNRIVEFVRAEGQTVGVEELLPSELILPAPDASLEEVRTVLREDGLIAG